MTQILTAEGWADEALFCADIYATQLKNEIISVVHRAQEQARREAIEECVKRLKQTAQEVNPINTCTVLAVVNMCKSQIETLLTSKPATISIPHDGTGYVDP